MEIRGVHIEDTFAEAFPMRGARVVITARTLRWARDQGESPAAVAIAWVLSRAPHVIALPGSRSLDHWRQIVRGAGLSLSADQLARIDAILPAGWAHGARYGTAMAQGPEGWA